jgi:hypothetical protein
LKCCVIGREHDVAKHRKHGMYRCRPTYGRNHRRLYPEKVREESLSIRKYMGGPGVGVNLNYRPR